MRTKGSKGKRVDSYFDAGPLATVLQGEPRARILDQALLLGNAEFTVSGLAEGTDLSFKTVKLFLKHLVDLKWVIATRKMGNAQAYRFNVENHMKNFIDWATKFQRSRLTNTN
jgi:DNA-binding transcriptional regulator GbsR (MarR family)